MIKGKSSYKGSINRVKFLFLPVLLLLVSFSNVQNRRDYNFEQMLLYRNVVEEIIDLNDDSLKLSAIEFLLNKRGDKGVNKTWFSYTNTEERAAFFAEQSASPEIQPYATNQLVSLYLISSLFHADLSFCNEIAISYELDGKTIRTTNLRLKKRRNKIKYVPEHNDEIYEIYDIYEVWFKELKVKGIQNMCDPLANAKYKWPSNDMK